MFFEGTCDKCKYYSGDVNQGGYSCGCCHLIEHGKPNAEFSEYGYHYSLDTCDVRKEDGEVYEKNYKNYRRASVAKEITRLKARIKELETELESEV